MKTQLQAPAGLTSFLGPDNVQYSVNALNQISVPIGVNLDQFFQVGFVVADLPNHWYVDVVNGLETNNGSRNAPFKTFAKAMGQAVNGDWIHVASTRTGHDGIHEQVTTPVGLHYVTVVNGLGAARGGTWKATSAGANAPLITLQGFGWRFIGFKFEPQPGYSAVQLLRNASVDGSDAEFWDCEFHGETGIEDHGGCGNWQAVRCRFHDCVTAAIKNTATYDLPLRVRLLGCQFVNNTNHVLLPLSDSIVWQCLFQDQGNSQTAAAMLDLRNGASGRNLVYQNLFTGTYSHTGGYHEGTNDRWYDNDTSAGKTSALPV